MVEIVLFVKQSNGLRRVAQTFHVRAAQRVENAHLTGEFCGSCPERSVEGLMSPTLGKTPFLKDLSPFGPAPDVNVWAILTKPLWRLFPYGKMKTCL